MGLASRCQRSLLRLASPRQHTVKLLLIVLSVTIWIFFSNELQSTSVGVVIAAEPKPTAGELSASNEVIKFKRGFENIAGPTIQQTKRPMNLSIAETSEYETSEYETTEYETSFATTGSLVEQEKSRIRLSKRMFVSVLFF